MCMIKWRTILMHNMSDTDIFFILMVIVYVCMLLQISHKIYLICKHEFL